MDHKQSMWRQEVYNEMVYKESLPEFHTFEGETHMVGIAFAFPSEARGVFICYGFIVIST